jgi:hypothetical protein
MRPANCLSFLTYALSDLVVTKTGLVIPVLYYLNCKYKSVSWLVRNLISQFLWVWLANERYRWIWPAITERLLRPNVEDLNQRNCDVHPRAHNWRNHQRGHLHNDGHYARVLSDDAWICIIGYPSYCFPMCPHSRYYILDVQFVSFPMLNQLVFRYSHILCISWYNSH